MGQLRKGAIAFWAIVVLLLSLSTAVDIMNGNLKSGLTPGWVNFAISNPYLFTVILVAGTLLFGPIFAEAVDSF